MTEYTAKEFQIQFSQKPEEVFNLQFHLTMEVKRELYTGEPGKELVKLVYGILGDRFPFRVRVTWVLKNFVLHGRIDRIWMFDDELELLEYRLAHDGDDLKPNQN